MLFDCRPKVLHKHCLQFLLGVKMAPRETENNAYAKFWGDKQRTLWYVMVFLEWSIELYYINTRGGGGPWEGGALINTNEIRGELSRENMISSHVKITRYLHHPTRRQHLRSKRSPLLWLHNKSRLSQLKNVYIYI